MIRSAVSSCLGRLLAAALAIEATPEEAHSAGYPLSAQLSVLDGEVHAHADLSALIDDAQRQALSSGFTTNWLLAFRWEGDSGGLPPLAGMEIRVRFEVWEEWYVVQIRTPIETQTRRFRKLARLETFLAHPPPLEIGPLSGFPEGVPIQLAVKIWINSMSEAEAERVRQWIQNPLGSDSSSGWIGAMIGRLVNEQSGLRSRESEGRSPVYRRRGETLDAAH